MIMLELVDALTVQPVESVAPIVKGETPTKKGIPEIVPVAELMLNPGGRPPLATKKVKGVVKVPAGVGGAVDHRICLQCHEDMLQVE